MFGFNHNCSKWFVLGLCLISGGFAFSSELEAKTKTKETHFWIRNYNEFVAEKVLMSEAFHIPGTTLNLDPATTKGWIHRLTNHFQFEEGNNVLLHFRSNYSVNDETSLNPDFVFQINLELPAHKIKGKKNQRLEAKEIKGYVSWVNEDFPRSEITVPIKKGFIQLFKPKHNELKGRLYLFFDHEKLRYPLHIYGLFDAPYKSKGTYALDQSQAKQRLRWQSSLLDEFPVSRDRLRSRYEYKKKYQTRWSRGRTTSVWQDKDRY